MEILQIGINTANSFYVIMHNLRKKLLVHGVMIVNEYDDGYMIKQDHLRVAKTITVERKYKV